MPFSTGIATKNLHFIQIFFTKFYVPVSGRQAKKERLPNRRRKGLLCQLGGDRTCDMLLDER